MAYELGLQRWIDKAIKLVDKDIVSRELLKTLGEEVRIRIKRRTRLGYGVQKHGAPKTTLKSMRKHSDIYSAWRKKNSKELFGETTPSKHNLTLTGQMLNSLKVTQISPKDKKLSLGFSNSFAEDKAKFNQARGWRFLYLSDAEIKGINNFYRREVRKLAKKF